MLLMVVIDDRTFRLFDFLGLKKHDGLMPYWLTDERKVCPSYFNDQAIAGPTEGDDPYKINADLPKSDQIPVE